MTPYASSFPALNMIRRGFTLIETIIYVALLAGVVAAMVALFTSGLETQGLVAAQSRMANAQRLVELTMQKRLAEAPAVTVPASGSGSVLTVTSPTPAESPVSFTLSGTTLMMQLGAGAAAALTPSYVRVTAFTVTRLSGTPASVRVVASFATDAPRTTITATSTFTVTLPFN